MTGPTQEMCESAARHLMDGVRRNDAKPPREAALCALGREATEAQITEWLAVWRPEALAAEQAS